MAINNVLASVAVKDLKTAVSWYANVLGHDADSTPMPEVAEWKFKDGGWLQVYQLPERAGAGTFTLAVSDLGKEIEKSRLLGIDTSQQTSGEKVETVMITDPDGNHIAFAEALILRWRSREKETQ
jgi:predicted enzyme related to lactoylglutathione lyase